MGNIDGMFRFLGKGADMIVGTHNSAVSAAGTTASDATQLVADANLVTTVGSNTGVKLPDCGVKSIIWVFNGQGSNVLKVYPPTGEQLNGLTATSGSVSIAASKGAVFVRLDNTQWGAIYA